MKIPCMEVEIQGNVMNFIQSNHRTALREKNRKNYLDRLLAITRRTLGVLDGEIDLSSDDADAETLIRYAIQLDHARRTPDVRDRCG